MDFALEEIRLWKNLEKTAVDSPTVKAKKNNSEDPMEKIYTQEEKISEFQDNTSKDRAKIKKIHTETIQKNFLSVKASGDWTSKDFSNYLKIGYSLQNWASK